MSQPNIYCMTSDKYLPALLPYSYLLNKYWQPTPSVTVVGFSEPNFDLPDNFEFLSLGSYRDYPFERWSDALIKLLGTIQDESFVLMLEDYWITRHVDTRAVKILYDYSIQFGYVLKVDLCGDRLYAYGADLDYGVVSYLDLVKSMPGSPYHMSLMTGIWRKDNLMRCLVPNESPHDIEIIGTPRVSHMQDLLVLGTRQWPVRHILGLRARDHAHINTDGLNPVDIEAMEKLGYFDYWKEKA